MVILIDEDAPRGYAELRCRTNFSFLRGASHADELMKRADELRLKALAIADLNGVYSLPKAFLALKELDPQLALICGAEVTLEGHSRLTFLARNRAGYGLLCRMLTASYENREKGEAQLSWQRFLELCETHALGAAGLTLISDPGPRLATLKEFFPGRTYIAIERFLDGHDQDRNAESLQAARTHALPLVATNDVHNHIPERRVLQDALTAIREGVTLKNAGRKLFSNAERHLKSPAQMIRLFQDHPEAIRNTLKIAEDCTFCLSELRYQYPSEWIPQGETAMSFLTQLVWKGARWRCPKGIPEDVQKQILHEMKLVAELQFADYFLTIWDIVEFARREQILCQGRGSAANSVLCYCLGITAIDPVRMKLLFERFVSTERGEPPDIDVDFEHERREEVIQYIYQKYGRERAAMVSAVVTYRSRSSIREMSKVLGEEMSRTELERALEKKTTPFHEQVDHLARELRGFPRHLSIHSGGFILSSAPIIETVPVEPARMEGRTIIQWDKYDLDALGLLKIDVLSLGMLSAIRKTLDQVGLTLATVPAEDPETYDMIGRGDTVGVFQIESRAQMNMLGRLQPRTFYDLVVEVAIVRPGPIVGKMVHPYLRRRRGEEPVEYPHPDLREILGRTLGVPLFQEQVMKMAIQLAGFSAGEADRLRRAIGAWRSVGSIEDVGKRLKTGLLAKGISEEFVQRVFDQIKGFAEYGFPESHAASFALLAYASSYLKCHHPVEFTAALINSQPMGFYANHTLIDDLKRHGREVLPVDPNLSDWDCTVTADGKLRLGFRVTKGLHKEDVERLIQNREQEGPFQNLAHFLSRGARAGLKRHHFETLSLGDAFRCFGLDQRHSLWQILAYELTHQDETPTSERGQLNLFSEIPVVMPPRKLFTGLTAEEEIQSDYESFGLSVRGHPMEVLREKLRRLKLPSLRAAQVKQLPHGKQVSICGMMIIRQRPSTAKGACFATLEDETGFLDLTLWRRIFEKFKEVFLDHAFLIVNGEFQKDGHSSSLVVSSLRPLVVEKKLRLPENYPVKPGW